MRRLPGRSNQRRSPRMRVSALLACTCRRRTSALPHARGGKLMTDTAVSTGIPASTLQVIGAGFGRTGTASMREALVRLGFAPCDHMVENFETPERFALWDEGRRRRDTGEPIDWRPLLTGFQA